MNDRDEFYGDSAIWDHEYCDPNGPCNAHGGPTCDQPPADRDKEQKQG